MTAADVRKALRKRYSDSRRYAIAEEVGLSTGYSHRRLDMMILDCYYSNGFRIDGIEIKVSTQDLRRELEDPEKHVAFFDVIDYYTLAVPHGVADPLMDIIPKNWGILIVEEDGVTRLKRKPLALQDKKADRPIPRAFFASVTRSIQGLQPSAQELQSEYERGLKEGREQEKRHRGYMEDRVAREAANLEAYDKLCSRFEIWRGDDIDKILDAFEAFRKLRTEWVVADIEGTIKRLDGLKKMLQGGQ